MAHAHARPRVPRGRRGPPAVRHASSSTWAAASTPASTSPATRPPTPHGFRGDVLDLVRELGPTVVRYPGGNFVSGYRWEDGVGPADERPRRLDLAWRSSRPTSSAWTSSPPGAGAADLEPMMAVNLGTRGVQEAADLLEYCNHPAGTALSDLRRANGAEEPHDIQRLVPGQRDGRALADRAQDRRRVRPARRRDGPGHADGRPAIELVACGSSNSQDADLRGVGGDGARAVLRPRRLHLAAHLLRPARRRPRRASWPARSTSTG